MTKEEKTKKCKQEVEKLLDRYSCAIIATPVFRVGESNSLKVTSEVKIVHIIKHIIKPKKDKYIN
ncbi:hypothetical protein LCGC14_2177810 [marine sediment metagenome]|uniref:Uncharacterized protein n=1 Tax=marine sediment metagenome TaxID=412755 RepID=A0A0F9GIZ9_9ZZZZ